MPIPCKPSCVRLLQAVATACLLPVVWRAHDLPVLAADWHVATNGSPDGLGTQGAPWDLGSALDGRQKVRPNDTLWIHQGHYKSAPKVGGLGYVVRLAGRDGAPVQVRAWQGQRVTIDGGLNVQPPSTHLWIWDLEILVSDPRPSAPIPPDPTYANVNRPWGGLNVSGGRNCKFINLVIHDNTQGVSWWVASQDSEMHGCIIYDNGWLATDRGHGHCIYTQNKEGTKTISNCILSCKYDGTYTMHAYGSSRADVDSYLIEDSIFYGKGPFLVGGGKPSHNIRVFRNYLYNVDMRIGYNAPSNEDCEIRDNVIANGDLVITKYNKVVNEGNLVLKRGEKLPQGTKAALLPNKYDTSRAHLAIFNWQQAKQVQVPVKPFLKPGDAFRLMKPEDLFGKPVFEGACKGETITVPVDGEFAVFVVLKGG